MLKYSSSPTGPRLPLAFQPRAPTTCPIISVCVPSRLQSIPARRVVWFWRCERPTTWTFGWLWEGGLLVCFCFKLKSYSCVSRACLCQTGERLRCFRLLLWCGGTLQPGLTPPHLLRCEPSKPALIRGRGGSLADEGCKKLQVHTCERAAGMS